MTMIYGSVKISYRYMYSYTHIYMCIYIVTLKYLYSYIISYILKDFKIESKTVNWNYVEMTLERDEELLVLT